MDISAKKLELMQLLLQEQQEAVLLKVEKFLKKNEKVEANKTDWWLELSEEEQKEIKLGVKQIEEGDTIAHDEVMKIFKKYK